MGGGDLWYWVLVLGYPIPVLVLGIGYPIPNRPHTKMHFLVLNLARIDHFAGKMTVFGIGIGYWVGGTYGIGVLGIGWVVLGIGWAPSTQY